MNKIIGLILIISLTLLNYSCNSKYNYTVRSLKKVMKYEKNVCGSMQLDKIKKEILNRKTFLNADTLWIESECVEFDRTVFSIWSNKRDSFLCISRKNGQLNIRTNVYIGSFETVLAENIEEFAIHKDSLFFVTTTSNSTGIYRLSLKDKNTYFFHTLGLTIEFNTSEYHPYLFNLLSKKVKKE